MGHDILLTGWSGFIGKDLVNTIDDEVIFFFKDINNFDPNSLDRVGYVFHFGSPSSQVLFAKNPEYCTYTTINGLKNVIEFCRQVGAKLIYPTTGLLSSDKPVLNEYAMCKYLSEKIVQKSGIESVGYRIYAGYGPGEEHKGDYKSVVGLFLEDIMFDRQPVIYGDGNQKRDFIYIGDITKTIIDTYKTETGIIEVGSGISTSFNEIVRVINEVVNKDIKPIYIDRPTNYIDETICKNPIINPTSLEDGIKRYYESYRNYHNS